MAQLSADCLNDILEYLEDDMINLHSCLLVNRLWCNVSVRIFWKNVWNYKTSNFRTLISCLPKESKENLCKNRITVLNPNSKSPMFNYASFCKFLSIRQVRNKLESLLRKYIKPFYTFRIPNDVTKLTQEIIKLFFVQISSLKKLELCESPDKINFYPGTKVGLKNISKLYCISNISSEIFYLLSQTCHNISSLEIKFGQFISEGLIDLISVQKNLQSFGMMQLSELAVLTPLIEKIPNTLIKLNIHKYNFISLLFIARFTNLQEINLHFYCKEDFIDFEKLQYAIFPNLQILKIQAACPKFDLLIRFLENNGNNLKECYIGDEMGHSDNSLNLAIAKFCPNLKKLSTGFKNNELETMKIVFNSCQYLESINIWCGGKFLSEKEALESIVKYSHENFYEIIWSYQYYHVQLKLLPEELESFFISWMDRVPQKSLYLVTIKNNAYSLDASDENMEIINKYIKLNVIKKFKVIDFNDNEFNWCKRM
ncbi:hypothetical protein C1645_871843 [Glomus cerebriforme]|uniref:F-box domain-containing protein n=1 Tax=Glomus cerebriforme TaxID=658196 RepID=A0A397TFQ6_9GLOM|nr:hypothetical protein C1645_871843 [Glomus cerebriforme]